MQKMNDLIKRITWQFLASSLEEAKSYVREPEELEKVLKFATLTADLVNDSATFTGTGEVKYQHMEFSSFTPGTYTFASGYTGIDVNTTWKTLNLTQDIGNSISIDKIKDEEALGDGLVRFVKRYIQRIQAPAVDKYRFSVITSKVNTFCKLLTLTSSNILEQFLHAKARMEDARIDTANLICYITPTEKQLLKEAAMAKGYYSFGNWAGNLDAEVEMVDGIKIIPTPSSLFATNVQFIMIHVDAVPAFEKYAETEFFDKIPGHGGRKLQADIGLYHDCFVYDELTRAVYVSRKTAATVYTITYDDGADSSTGSAPTETDKAPDAEFVLKDNTFTVTGKTFVGWSDGTHLYPAGAKYVMPANNITLTAIWKD